MEQGSGMKSGPCFFSLGGVILSKPESGPNWARWRRALTAIHYCQRPVVYSRFWKEEALMLSVLLLIADETTARLAK